MRTVLAVDEMLAAAVRRRLGEEGIDAVALDHMEMRDLGEQVVSVLRELVMQEPSVLVIGGRAWDALPLLRLLRLPREVPVVLLTPEATWERQAEACRLGAVSIVPANEGTDTREVITLAVCLATASSLAPVLVARDRRPAARQSASVVAPRVPAWEAWAATK